MKIEEFLKLRPYDSIYNKESKSLEVIDAIDLVKKMVLIESGLYSFKDLKTKEYYIENIFGEEIAKHAIIICVSHKEELLKRSRKILVIEEGKVMDTGTHESLLNSSITYKKLYENQREGER